MNTITINSLHTVVYTVGRITPNGINLLGTCFLLNKQSLFATAAHVTSNDDNNLVIVTSTGTNLASYQDTSNNQVQAIKASIYAIDPIRDICLLKIDQEVKANGLIGGSDDVNVSDSLAIVGYPHCTEGRRVLTYQTSVVGAKVLIEAAGIKSKHLILNIQTRPGQSGSPVFENTNSKLVAMIIGSYAPQDGVSAILANINPATLHQTTHAISSEYILKMV
jgi:V8-like Glu-specific endopeptidase